MTTLQLVKTSPHGSDGVQFIFVAEFVDIFGTNFKLTYELNLFVDRNNVVNIQTTAPVYMVPDFEQMAHSIVGIHAKTRVDEETHNYIREELKKHIPERIRVL